MTANFTQGEVYFRIKYSDKNFYYPTIDSFVFIGKNLSDEDKEDTWYFQFTTTFGKAGAVVESKSGDRRVVLVTQADLHEMLETRQLAEALNASQERRLKKDS